MTLCDLQRLQGHSSTANLFKYDVSYSCAAVDKISSDVSRSSMIAELFVILGYDAKQQHMHMLNTHKHQLWCRILCG